MGLYDELDDVQVKCFSVSTISPKLVKNRLDISFLGGKLRSYGIGDIVPYRTPYYNYGENFIIYDFRIFNLNKELDENKIILTVIQNGKFIGNYSYYEYEQKYGNLKMPLVVDHYGRPISIYTLGDIKEIMGQWVYYQKLNMELQKMKCISYGIPYKLLRVEDFEKENSNHIDYMDYLTLYNKASDEAFNETLKKFNAYWFEPCTELFKNINFGNFWGSVYEYASKYDCIEYDKYFLCKGINGELEYEQKSFSESYIEYLKWCSENDIKIDKEVIVDLYDKYNTSIPESVIEEYKNSRIYQDRLFIHGKDVEV